MTTGHDERQQEKRRPLSPSECPACGGYMPMTLGGTERVHRCDRTPPSDGLPPHICVCPICGGVALFRYGCWGTSAKPHPHAYMLPTHELVSLFLPVREPGHEQR